MITIYGCSTRLVRALWHIRWKLGAIFRWDGETSSLGARVTPLENRLPPTLQPLHRNQAAGRSCRSTNSRTNGRRTGQRHGARGRAPELGARRAQRRVSRATGSSGEARRLERNVSTCPSSARPGICGSTQLCWIGSNTSGAAKALLPTAPRRLGEERCHASSAHLGRHHSRQLASSTPSPIRRSSRVGTATTTGPRLRQDNASANRVRVSATILTKGAVRENHVVEFEEGRRIVRSAAQLIRSRLRATETRVM